MNPDELARVNRAARTGDLRLFHGGAPDLLVGSLLLPPSVTGAPSMRDISQDAGFSNITTSRNRVYVTTERSLAAAIAAAWSTRVGSAGWGWVYGVEIDDEDLEPDADMSRGPFTSFQTPRARIASVLTRGVDPRDGRHGRRLAEFIRQLG